MDSLMINFKNISICRANKLVLSKLTGAVRRGRFTGIIGSNGAGKTSLLRCFAGLESPISGKVRIENDLHLESLSVEQRSQKIAWLAAESTVPFDYSVDEIVTMGRFPWHQGIPVANDFEKITLAIKQFELTDLRQRSFNSLSSGQQQRVMLARVSAGDAHTLLLDEPTTFLDPKLAHFTMQTLKALTAADLTVVAAINDINLVARYCDDILVIHQKKLLSYGSVRAILNPKLLREVFDIDSKRLEVGDYAQYLIV